MTPKFGHIERIMVSYMWTLSRFNVVRIRHHFLIISVKERIILVHLVVLECCTCICICVCVCTCIICTCICACICTCICL